MKTEKSRMILQLLNNERSSDEDYSQLIVTITVYVHTTLKNVIDH